MVSRGKDGGSRVGRCAETWPSHEAGAKTRHEWAESGGESTADSTRSSSPTTMVRQPDAVLPVPDDRGQSAVKRKKPDEPILEPIVIHHRKKARNRAR